VYQPSAWKAGVNTSHAIVVDSMAKSPTALEVDKHDEAEVAHALSFKFRSTSSESELNVKVFNLAYLRRKPKR